VDYTHTEDEGLAQICELADMDVLAPEDCPEPDYWHWRVLKVEQLPDWLKDNYANYGEIRYYWN
jgi:hypothetical protein